MSTTTKPRKPRGKSQVGRLHKVAVGHQVETNVEGHIGRTDSPEFAAARTTLHKILETFTPNPFGSGTDVQAHHGGSIWVHTGAATNPWHIVLNWAGIEWSTQFCCDPVKVERLRQNVLAITNGFPRTVPELQQLGYHDTAILTTPITSSAEVARYVDSIWNACVPIPQPQHIGAVKPAAPLAAGVHTYPEPACAIERVMHDDFVPYVVDSATKKAAIVVPVAPRGSGNGRVRVVYTEKGHPLRASHTRARDAGRALILEADSPIAKRAFKLQK